MSTILKETQMPKNEEFQTDTPMENLKALQEMYQRAVNIQMGLESHTIHPKGVVKFAASDSLCPRMALLKGIRPIYIPEFEVSTLRKFRVGDIFHKMADEGIEKVLWEEEGKIIKVNPFSLRCFPDLFKGTFPDCVRGTPDHILLMPEKRMLMLVDQKSANDFGFGKNKKHGASIYHSIQVGTYFDSLRNSPLKDWIDAGSMSICYMSKESVEISMARVTGDYVTMAREYWTLVADSLNAIEKEGRSALLPPAIPREEWACGYCPFFGSDRKLDRSKKAIEACRACPTLLDFDKAMSPGAVDDDMDLTPLIGEGSDDGQD
jgi:hypothetical protein